MRALVSPYPENPFQLRVPTHVSGEEVNRLKAELEDDLLIAEGRCGRISMSKLPSDNFGRMHALCPSNLQGMWVFAPFCVVYFFWGGVLCRYRDLSLVPLTDLTLKQCVQVRVYEALQQEKSLREKVSADLDILRSVCTCDVCCDGCMCTHPYVHECI